MRNIEILAPTSTKINLWEWRLAHKLAQARTAQDKKHGYYRKSGSRAVDESLQDFIGVMGELAYHKLADRYYDPCQDPRVKAGTPDTIIETPVGIYECDIKTSARLDSWLNVSEEAKHHWDIYILMVIDMTKRVAHYRGYVFGSDIIKSKRLFKPRPIDGMQRAKFYYMKQEQLHKDLVWKGERL